MWGGLQIQPWWFEYNPDNAICAPNQTQVLPNPIVSSSAIDKKTRKKTLENRLEIFVDFRFHIQDFCKFRVLFRVFFCKFRGFLSMVDEVNIRLLEMAEEVNRKKIKQEMSFKGKSNDSHLLNF